MTSAPPLETRHLVLVQTIAEERSVTRAAARLHVSQPALSHALADVEERVGAALFTRSRGMTPTAAGERVLVVARRVLEDLAELRRSFAGKPAAVPVRVSTGCYTAYPWLPPVLAELAAEGAGVELRIVLEATRTPLPALAAGTIDLAITADLRTRKGLHVTHLFDDELVAVLATSHPLARKKYLTPRDFAAVRLLVYDAPLAGLDVWRRFLKPARVRPREVAQVPITEAIVELARAGQGVGVLARWAVAHYATRGELVTRKLGGAGLPRVWVAVRRAGDTNAGAIDSVTAAIARAAPRGTA
jgi:LysR family transcriptional regulator, regulator for metE and metH